MLMLSLAFFILTFDYRGRIILDDMIRTIILVLNMSLLWCYWVLDDY